MGSRSHLADSALFQLLMYTGLRVQLTFDKEASVLCFSNDMRTFLSFRKKNEINTQLNENFLELTMGILPVPCDFLHFSNHYRQQHLAVNYYDGQSLF